MNLYKKLTEHDRIIQNARQVCCDDSTNKLLFDRIAITGYVILFLTLTSISVLYFYTGVLQKDFLASQSSSVILIFLSAFCLFYLIIALKYVFTTDKNFSTIFCGDAAISLFKYSKQLFSQDPQASNFDFNEKVTAYQNQIQNIAEGTESTDSVHEIRKQIFFDFHMFYTKKAFDTYDKFRFVSNIVCICSCAFIALHVFYYLYSSWTAIIVMAWMFWYIIYTMNDFFKHLMDLELYTMLIGNNYSSFLGDNQEVHSEKI